MPDGGGSQKTETSPWGGVKPYLKEGYRAAEANILDRPTEFFPGQTYVDYSPETEQALAAQAQRAGANPLLQLGQGQVSDTLSGAYLGANPYLDQLGESVLSTVRPSIDSMFGGASGRLGSPAHAEALGRGVSNAMAPYLFGEYGAERNRMMQASGMAPGLAREDYFDIGQLRGVGTEREALERQRLQDEISRFEFGQQEPTSRTMQFMQALGGSAPLIGGAGTTRVQQPGMNPLLMGLGAATTLAGGATMYPF